MRKLPVSLLAFALWLQASPVLAGLLQTPEAASDPQKNVSKPKADVARFSPDKFFMIRTVGNGAWSPDGCKLACAVKPKTSPTYEIVVLGLASRQLTPVTAGTKANYTNMSPIWSPDGKYIAYTQEEAKATE
jgi:hypothetical protein